MPRRTDLHKILIIGSGPIVIGQACEFDYSGTQACKALREEGFEVVLVNSNPATIMTDPEFATATYVEPLLPGPVRQVIEREKPDALLRPEEESRRILVRIAEVLADAEFRVDDTPEHKEAVVKLLGSKLPEFGLSHEKIVRKGK